VFLDEKRERRKERTVKDHKRHLDLLGFKCQLADVTHQDMERKLKRLPPSEFNHRLACAKTFLTWAQKKRYITENPTVGLTPHKRAKRKRILTDEELRTVWRGTDQLTGHFKEIVRLLILMGQRRGETAAMQDVYYSNNQQTLTLPSEITKNGREHTFPVGPIAAEILARNIRKERPSSLLFQAVGSTKPFSGWSKCKAELDKLAPIAPWTLHDLRRTFRTTLGRLKVRPDIAERLVNHVSARTDMEETYDLHLYLEEMREAIEKWEVFMQSVCIDVPASTPYFIGVWDTVAAMGWQRVFPQWTYDRHFPHDVKYARHLQSIDETRSDFVRVPWGGHGTVKWPERKNEPEQFDQIWFSGNHADVGGSYPENESRLSDITLKWMVDFVTNEVPQEGRVIADLSLLHLYPSSSGMMHDECMVGIGGSPISKPPPRTLRYAKVKKAPSSSLRSPCSSRTRKRRKRRRGGC
jgi:integrase